MSHRDIVVAYGVIPIFISFVFYMPFRNKGKSKALMFSFCAVGSYLPLLKTFLGEVINIQTTVSKIMKPSVVVCIIEILAGMTIIVATTITWIGSVDAAYQLIFPKKKKQKSKSSKKVRRCHSKHHS